MDDSERINISFGPLLFRTVTNKYTNVTHKDSTPKQLPKSQDSDHYTVDKYSVEQNIGQCQHPAEGTHIHVIQQVRPQGMKKTAKKQRNTCKSF